MNEEIKVSKSEYEKMQRNLRKLEALEAGGVDSWDFYGDSLKDWRKENELHELVGGCIENINDILVDAEVGEPAGSGCGYQIDLDEDAVKKLFLKFLRDASAINNDT